MNIRKSLEEVVGSPLLHVQSGCQTAILSRTPAMSRRLDLMDSVAPPSSLIFMNNIDSILKVPQQQQQTNIKPWIIIFSLNELQGHSE